jgi:hypothetical protein
MLRNSWKILVNRSLNFEGLVPRGSYSLRITERLWGSGAWLIWLSPPAELETQASGKADLNQLSAYIRKQLAGKKTSQFIHDLVTAKNLTGMESTVLAYVVAVVRGQTATKALGDQIERIGWLRPLNSLYRKIFPSTLEQKAAGRVFIGNCGERWQDCYLGYSDPSARPTDTSLFAPVVRQVLAKSQVSCRRELCIFSHIRHNWAEANYASVGADSDSVNLGSNPGPPASRLSATLWLKPQVCCWLRSKAIRVA